MSINGALARGRRAALARMTSRAIVRHPTGNTVVGPDGFTVPEWVVVYDGPFRLAGADRGGSGSRTSTVGGVEVTLATRVASFPHGTTGLSDGDLIEVTAGECVGLVLRILETTGQDQATALRLPVVETQRPQEWV